MAVIIPPGFLQCVINLSGPTASGGASTVLGLTDGSVTDLTAAANDIALAWADELAPITHNSFALEDVVLLTATEIGVGSSLETVGQRTGDLAPPNTSVLMRKVTGERGPKNQGRSFWPGMVLDADIFDDGTLTTGARGSIQAGVSSFFTALAALGHAHVILHSLGDDTPTVVTSEQIETKVATQRRRLR